MSSIAQVIAASRRATELTERRRFTIARQSAIRKMRRFALADPHYYVLELIQAAVANGARYVDAGVGDEEVLISWVGGGFRGADLDQLFDFLFASKDDLDVADLRQLALGTNALLLGEPDSLVIESGFGTLDTTRRLVIKVREDAVEVGTPAQPIAGTYVHARGLRRKRFGAGGRIEEITAIETRCMTASIPIVFNGVPVFGTRSVRIPRLFGYDRTVAIDEGDLYGVLGLGSGAYLRTLKLLTFGVWVTSEEVDLVPGRDIGGVVAFDRLRKTADHAGIVHDDVYREMIERLRPYAWDLVGGRQTRRKFEVQRLDVPGILDARGLRAAVADVETVILLTDAQVKGARRRAAETLVAAMGQAAFVVAERYVATFRALIGDRHVIEPSLEAGEIAFYRRPPSPLPRRPWLLEPVEAAPLPARDLAAAVAASTSVLTEDAQTLQTLVQAFGGDAARIRVFTPEAPAPEGVALRAEVRAVDRVVWAGPVPSAFPGHVVVIDLPRASIRALRADLGDGTGPLAARIGAAVAHRLTDTLAEVAAEALRQMTTRPLRGPRRAAGSHIALAALARGAVWRLERDRDGALALRIGLVEGVPARALDVPIVETLTGRSLCARGLEELMAACHGLIYATVEGVRADLEGLDQDRILALDAGADALLAEIVGEPSYVRVDAREVIASAWRATCRDVALGLRDYVAVPGLDLLIEGELAGTSPRMLEGALLAGLVERFRLRAFGPDGEDLRRQAARHLQWWVCQRWRRGEQVERADVRGLPLFRDMAGEPVSVAALEAAIRRRGAVRIADGWAADSVLLGADALAAPDGEEALPDVYALALDPWVVALLSEVTTVQPLFEATEAGPGAAGAAVDAVVTLEVDDAHVTGTLLLPRVAPDVARVRVIDPETEQLGFFANPLGVVGQLAIKGARFERSEQITAYFGGRCEAVLRRGLELLPQLQGADRDRVLEVLLGFVGRHMRVSRRASGLTRLDVHHPLAEAVLDSPLVPGPGGRIDALFAVLQRWVDALNAGREAGPPVLGEACPAPIAAWVARVCRAPAIHVMGPHAPPTEPPATRSAHEHARLDALAGWLSAQIAALRPDAPAAPLRIFIGDAGSPGAPLRFEPGVLGHLDEAAQGPTLYLNDRHPLVARALAGYPDRESGAWLLLACYGWVNWLDGEVTNAHELDFQARVLDWLRAGEGGDEPAPGGLSRG